ncbi:hypothetical protein [Vreelandella alkaliphila]|uniref:Uncharacterized protein n=1 Tax=Vreelandella alkaliphila TaxID=272774 RepID=A0AAJ2S4C5_9GAMM|nr:hypothetical protein [Halomonas alkaliphila]MDX5979651.1 hypothetical protein [Halomonas alkaliphila]
MPVIGGGDPNIAAMRQISKQMVQTPFREGWQFRVEIESAPSDWDLYCKEVSQTPIELEVKSKRVGAHYLNYYSGAQPVGLSLTMRDNEDGRIFKWMEQWVGKVVYPDGTWGLPIDYLRTCKIFDRLRDGSEALRQELRVQPLTIGELTESVDRSGALLEFPITLVEFRGGEINY